MKRFYIECSPIRRGLTGREYLGQHIDAVFAPTKFYPVFDNGLIQFGYLEGDDDSLCNVLSICGNLFAAKRLFVEEFRGAARLYLDIDATSLNALFIEHSTEATSDILNDVKSYKNKLLKEKVKREFSDYNDLIANIAKEILLLEEYRSSLDGAQTARLEAALTTLKSIYDVETCLSALEEDVSKISSYMPSYYSIKTSLSDSTSLEDLKNISLIDDE